jgi:hypothetical protein
VRNGVTTRTHWALKDPNNKNGVVCLGLISHDNFSSTEDFKRELPVLFVEQSLSIIDSLLKEIAVVQEELRSYKDYYD